MGIVVAVFLAILLIGLGFCIVMILLQQRQEEAVTEDDEDCEATLRLPRGRWRIELWDIGLGVCYGAEFDGGVTLGRGFPGYTPPGRMAIGDDVTISRDQCLIYEQDGYLFLWNLSGVNQTLWNGNVLEEPAVLQAGDRLAMGGHTFLLTVLQEL